MVVIKHRGVVQHAKQFKAYSARLWQRNDWEGKKGEVETYKKWEWIGEW